MKWGALTLLEISHSRGCYLKFAVLLVQRVCSPKQPNTKDPGLCTLAAYIAGDTLHHQPMGAGHMTVLQLHGPMGFCVLQWCHPMLAYTKRTSYCTWIITLYGARKVDSGPHTPMHLYAPLCTLITSTCPYASPMHTYIPPTCHMYLLYTLCAPKHLLHASMCPTCPHVPLHAPYMSLMHPYVPLHTLAYF